MSNGYFQFKQFKIEQDECAMKVSTDACLQGAWSPLPKDATTVLDIGTGTGLLSLMLAQRFPDIKIDAIELEKNAARQATKNINQSVFKDRIKVVPGDVRSYSFDKKYDYIICNPPFFQKDLNAPEAGRNLARHSIGLSLEDLFETIQRLLLPQGIASVLLPRDTHIHWQKIVERSNWHFNGSLAVSHLLGGKVNRICSLCSALPGAFFPSEQIAIKEQDGSRYTAAFIRLLKDFYLYL